MEENKRCLVLGVHDIQLYRLSISFVVMTQRSSDTKTMYSAAAAPHLLEGSHDMKRFQLRFGLWMLSCG